MTQCTNTLCHTSDRKVHLCGAPESIFIRNNRHGIAPEPHRVICNRPTDVRNPERNVDSFHFDILVATGAVVEGKREMLFEGS